jgi:hypothetical protein
VSRHGLTRQPTGIGDDLMRNAVIDQDTSLERHADLASHLLEVTQDTTVTSLVQNVSQAFLNTMQECSLMCVHVECESPVRSHEVSDQRSLKKN